MGVFGAQRAQGIGPPPAAEATKARAEEDARSLASNTRPAPVLEAFDQARTRDLLAVAHHALSGGRAFVEFIDSERSLAMQAGIETIGVEVSSILAGKRFDRLVSSLEDSVKENEPAQISLEGLSELRRMERLLAEASSNINRFTNGGYRFSEISRAKAERDAERRHLEIRMQEQRLAALRHDDEAQRSFARQEERSLAGIDQTIDAGLAEAAGQPSAQNSTDRVLLLVLIGLGAATLSVIIAMALSSGK